MAVRAEHIYDRQSPGVAMIEFAICVVVLVLLASGILDYGIALREHAVMVEAARVGARAASAAETLDGAVLSNLAVNVSRDFLQSQGLDGADYGYRIKPVEVFAEDGTSMGWWAKLVISRPGGARFLLLVPKGFTSCVTSSFYIERGGIPAAVSIGPVGGCMS